MIYKITLILLVISLKISFVMCEKDLYSAITKWQTGTDMIDNQNCFALNLGFNLETPIPSISIPLDNRQNLKHYDFDNSYTCYFVFVGGKYIEDMKAIVDVVENITQQFHGITPIAMFVLGKLSTFKIDNLSSHGQHLTKV